jgi:hypothetical protein
MSDSVWPAFALGGTCTALTFLLGPIVAAFLLGIAAFVLVTLYSD